jgi:hypothetical protein
MEYSLKRLSIKINKLPVNRFLAIVKPVNAQELFLLYVVKELTHGKSYASCW